MLPHVCELRIYTTVNDLKLSFNAFVTVKTIAYCHMCLAITYQLLYIQFYTKRDMVKFEFVDMTLTNLQVPQQHSTVRQYRSQSSVSVDTASRIAAYNYSKDTFTVHYHHTTDLII